MRQYLICLALTLGLAQNWQNVGGGCDNRVNTLLSWNDKLYVGGRFTYVNGTALQTQGIAQWDGTQWQRIANPGAGGNGEIYALAVYNGKLIVGGDFAGIGNSNASNLAQYDPVTNTWSSVGGGTNGPVHALYVYDGELLVGGGFTRVGAPPNDQPIAFFARWDGTTWKAPDPNNTSQLLMGGNPRAFALYNGKLYVGGNFIAAYYNETDKAYLAIWDKATQRLLPAATTPPDNNVWALAVWNNKLYIGGEFSVINGVSAPKLAALNGNAFESVNGSPTSGQVRALLPAATELYVVGNFLQAGGQTVNRVAVLTSSGTWRPLGAGIGPLIVNALASYKGILYAGGNFTQDGAGQSLAYIAAFSSSPLSLTDQRPATITVRQLERTLLLQSEAPQTLHYQLVSLTGQTLEQGTLSLSQEPIALSLALYAQGLYSLLLRGQGYTQVYKVVLGP